MKSVLISIQPQWCELIASGKKTLEVRKTKPKMETLFKVYIYCTLSGCNEFFRDILGGDIARWNMEKWGDKKGMVIGEFICDKIKKFAWVPYDLPFRDDGEYYLDDDDMKQTCMSYQKFAEYGAELDLYGWHISNLVIYDKPKELQEFTGLRKTKFGYEPVQVTRPPQSWCYVEELT